MGQQMKVAEEVAAAEFSRMCEAFRVDQNTAGLDAKELKSWNDTRQGIIGDICRGALTIDTEGRPVYVPEMGKAVTFNRPTGATFMALETHKDKNISNTVAAMADMTGTNPGDFSRMFARDFKACSRIASLFLSEE